MNGFLAILTTALYTIFIQNLVFSGAYGASEALRIATKPRRFTVFTLMLTFFSVITSVLCYALDRIPLVNAFSPLLHFALYVCVLAAVFLIAAFVAIYAARPSQKWISTLGMAALNTLVLAIPYINRQAGYTLAGSIGSGLGAGLAFFLAAAMINKGLHKLSQNEHIPASFRGTPAMLLYVSLISLAFMGLSGQQTFT